MQVIILSAGVGTRLNPLTHTCPKPLIPVNGRRLIDHVLNSVDFESIDEIIVVGGYQFDKLKSHLVGSPKVILLENREYQFGNILTLQQAIPHLTDTTLIMNADHIYPKRLIQKVLAIDTDSITAICDSDRTLGADDMKVKSDSMGCLGLISKTLSDYDFGYIGMTKVPASQMEIYQRMFTQTLHELGSAANVESILGLAANRGVTVEIADLSGMGWIEIDTVSEWQDARFTLQQQEIESPATYTAR